MLAHFLFILSKFTQEYSHTDFRKKAMNIAGTTTQGDTTQADLSSKGKSCRKIGIQQALIEECKSTKVANDTGSDKFSHSVNNVIDLKVCYFHLSS
jgi:hypothetical protein